MRKIITIACSKGGVGKSTIALNLAIELNRRYAVTVLDLDYQILIRSERATALSHLILLELKMTKRSKRS